MRTLGTIIEEARDGNMPSLDECHAALLALAHLSDIIRNDPKLLRHDAPLCAMVEYARLMDPLEYLGENRPGHPEYDLRRKRANEIIARLDPAIQTPEVIDLLRQIGDTFPTPPPPVWFPTD